LPRINALGDYEIKFADRIRNCEHSLLIEEKGVAILGCDPGRDGMNTVMVKPIGRLEYLRPVEEHRLTGIAKLRVSSLTDNIQAAPCGHTTMPQVPVTMSL
jgi:hypothetical protein